VLFATRGIITDRNGREIAWNEIETNATASPPFPRRHYIEEPGFAHILGFVQYPKKDSSGEWWREEYSGAAGVEKAFDDVLAGQNGSSMSETDARGVLVREDIVDPPTEGGNLTLSVDAEVQSALARRLEEHARIQGFRGGAAAIMDVRSGELLSLVSFPEYDAQAFSDGDRDAIQEASDSDLTPLLNRAASGLYAPGSIVKPLFAAAALAEGIIDPEKKILSTGAITIPNPYNPDKPSIFRDWKAHGWVDMRRALAVSSDVYFYAIGGGFESQRGLGIAAIEKYARMFGLGAPVDFLGLEASGTIPSPAWKEAVFGKDEPWRLGDTYNTVIGQYGFQTTPLQMLRAIAAIANGGSLVYPRTTRADAHPSEALGTEALGISEQNLHVAREGMHAAVTEGGTAQGLWMPGISIAAKTGTAQVGMRNEFMNSWVVGFWPFEEPKYAFVVVLEKAPANTLAGAAPAMRPFFEWLVANKPEYTK
jgi:penicillin-binding protein 2